MRCPLASGSLHRVKAAVSKLETTSMGKSFSMALSILLVEVLKGPAYSPQGSSRPATSGVCHPSMCHAWHSAQMQLTAKTPKGCRGDLLEHPWWNGKCYSWQRKSRLAVDRHTDWPLEPARAREYLFPCPRLSLHQPLSLLGPTPAVTDASPCVLGSGLKRG